MREEFEQEHERRREIKQYFVRQKCHNCEVGWMVNRTGVVHHFLREESGTHAHKCDNCGFVDHYLKRYPRIEYVVPGVTTEPTKKKR
jgi:hypothetical protein